MAKYNIGSIVARKSYGQDIYFIVSDIRDSNGQKPVYTLRGLSYRVIADAHGDDLVEKDRNRAMEGLQRQVMRAKNVSRGVAYGRLFPWVRRRPGRIVHIDSSEQFLNICRNYYRAAGLNVKGYFADESRQPNIIGRVLAEDKPDILVITGHDGIKKDSGDLYSIGNYRNSGYFVECVKRARSYQADNGKLCIFAGACQSYFEAIMDAGANFASSPGRININALDPAIVSKRVALTNANSYVTPQQIARITVSGGKGIGGINTRGHLMV